MRVQARRIEAVAVDVTELCQSDEELCGRLRRVVPRDIGTVYYVTDGGREYIVAVGEDAVNSVAKILEEHGYSLELPGSVGGREVAAENNTVVSLVDRPRRGGSGGVEDVEVTPGPDPVFCVSVKRGESTWRCCTKLSIIEALVDSLSGGVLDIYALAERVASKFGLTQFFDNGVFDWKKFYGDRSTYHMYFYCPLRVLERIGAVTGRRKKRLIMEPAEVKNVLRVMLERVKG